MKPQGQEYKFTTPPGPNGGKVEAIGPGGERVELTLTPAQVHTAEDIATFLAGYKNWPYRADEAIKPVLVDKSAFLYRVFSSNDAFLRVNTRVGNVSPPVNIDPENVATEGYTENHSVGSLVPVQTEDEAAFSVKAIAGKRCMNAIMLDREIEVFTLLGLNTSWAANQRHTLGANEQWNDGSNSAPITKLNEAIEASAQPVTGIWFNQTVSNAFLRHDQVRDTMRQMLGDKGAGNVSNQASDYQIPGFPPFHVIGAKSRTAPAGALTYAMGDHVALVTAPPGTPTDAEEVASAYNFRLKGENGVGINVREWFVEGMGLRGAYMVNVTMAERPIMVGNDSGGHIATVIV